MAYRNRQLLIDQSLEAIKKYKLIWIQEIAAFLPISRATFYKKNLDKVDTIKEALERNKVELKVALRKKWYDSENAATQIALYKLIGTDEESDRINSQHVKQSGETKIIVEYTDGKPNQGQDSEAAR